MAEVLLAQFSFSLQSTKKNNKDVGSAALCDDLRCSFFVFRSLKLFFFTAYARLVEPTFLPTYMHILGFKMTPAELFIPYFLAWTCFQWRCFANIQQFCWSRGGCFKICIWWIPSIWMLCFVELSTGSVACVVLSNIWNWFFPKQFLQSCFSSTPSPYPSLLFRRAKDFIIHLILFSFLLVGCSVIYIAMTFFISVHIFLLHTAHQDKFLCYFLTVCHELAIIFIHFRG